MSEKFELKEITDEKDWQPLSLNSDTAFAQSFFYGQWQESVGRKVKRFGIFENGFAVCFFQMILYPLLGKMKYGYVPYGPVATKWPEELLIFLRGKIQEIIKKEHLVFIRTDFDPFLEASTQKKYFSRSSIPSYFGSFFQPRYEWLLSLDKTPEAMLLAMHEKAQYAIRASQKRGVSIEVVSQNIASRFKDFTSLMDATSHRKGFAIHEKIYYQKFFEMTHNSKDAYLVIASLGEEILCVNLCFLYGSTVMHLFGGSSDTHRSLQAPYLALWRSILYAKEKGAKHFNFGGISDPEEKIYKSLKNLTYFKHKFGGKTLRHSDFYDCVGRRFWYYLYILRKGLKNHQ